MRDTTGGHPKRRTAGRRLIPRPTRRGPRGDARRVKGPPGGRRFGTRDLQQTAQARVSRFRKGTILAVAITGLLLVLWGEAPDTAAQAPVVPTEEAQPARIEPVPDPSVSLEQAAATIRDLLLGFYGLLPKLVIVLLLLLAAGLAARLTRILLQRVLGRWERTDALATLLRIGIFLVALAASLSIMAGDVRALLGSIGLVGLALSWALQTPIESFTGWLINSLQGYYRVGDRIEVGEVFGDVYKIDVLTTTVWEAGGPGKSVAGAQSTGAMITFPNWEVLRSNVVNYSRDFPYVWDEVTVSVANESDLAYAMKTFAAVAQRVLGSSMVQPAQQYRQLLDRAKLAFDVEEEPRVFLSLADAWTNCTVRYLVPARARRRWATALLLALTAASNHPEHKGRIISAYPRTEVQLRDGWSVGEQGRQPLPSQS